MSIKLMNKTMATTGNSITAYPARKYKMTVLINQFLMMIMATDLINRFRE